MIFPVQQKIQKREDIRGGENNRAAENRTCEANENGGPHFPSQVKNGQPQGSFIDQNLVSACKTSPITPYQVCRIHLVNKLRSHW